MCGGDVGVFLEVVCEVVVGYLVLLLWGLCGCFVGGFEFGLLGC